MFCRHRVNGGQGIAISGKKMSTLTYSFLDRQVPRKPRSVGGVKGHNKNEISFPGSPGQWPRSFTFLARNKNDSSRAQFDMNLLRPALARYMGSLPTGRHDTILARARKEGTSCEITSNY